jgi:lipopolysaccharide/colanic/teichoic acid biosynthesis glycosyltransferase
VDLFDDEKFVSDGMNIIERKVKRVIDCLLAFLCLVVFSPLFVILYILIKREDGGRVIYKQERIGLFGRPFYIYKFRSMKLNAEENGPQLCMSDEVNDPRLTNIGRFLREHHLDELPQLWNVFVGDMAFVGPRPERKYYIDQILERDSRYVFLYQIRPGVTSYATLHNGYTDTMDKMLRRLRYDLFYLKHRSFLFDCAILWQTFVSIVFGKKF